MAGGAGRRRRGGGGRGAGLLLLPLRWAGAAAKLPRRADPGLLLFLLPSPLALLRPRRCFSLSRLLGAGAASRFLLAGGAERQRRAAERPRGFLFAGE